MDDRPARLRLRQALPFTQASTALTYVAPGGGIVGMAGSYGLLRAWGFARGGARRDAPGIWNQLANLLLPVVAVLLLSIEEQRDALLTTVAVIGAIVFAAAVGLWRSCSGATASRGAWESSSRASSTACGGSSRGGRSWAGPSGSSISGARPSISSGAGGTC